MKYWLFFIISTSIFSFERVQFSIEAPQVANELKTNLMKNLQQAIKDKGVVGAINFCNTNLPSIVKPSVEKYSYLEFGRTSHKLRQPKNIPREYIKKYLDQFAGTTIENKPINGPIIFLVENKNVYLEPLYIMPQCLNCHGEKISSNVSFKINELYPKDQATGFKLNEFRGFIWIKEK